MDGLSWGCGIVEVVGEKACDDREVGDCIAAGILFLVLRLRKFVTNIPVVRSAKQANFLCGGGGV